MSLGISQNIGTIENTLDWRYITIQMQKNQTDETDSRTGQTLSRGMRFYVDSFIPGLELTLPTTTTDATGQDWSLQVTEGSLYIDDFYWEGGMTNGDEGSSNLRPFRLELTRVES